MRTSARGAVEQGFHTLDTNLNLDPRVRLQAEARHREVEYVLTEAGLVQRTFLQGSFARKTMLPPLKDVDIVIVLRPQFWKFWGNPDGPAQAMAAFKAPIKRRWPTVEFDVDGPAAGKALRLTFNDVPFTIDLVPAFDYPPDDPDKTEYIVVGDRHERQWELSNTQIQNRLVRERNRTTATSDGHDGRFVHQVRELKAAVKNRPDLDFVTGIVSESLLYGVIETRLSDRDAMLAVLRTASETVRGPVTEPAGDDDVTIKWTTAERAVAVRTYDQMRALAEEALGLELAGDAAAACGLWHELFGDRFPSAVDRSTEEAMAVWGNSGSLTSTGRPSSTNAGKQPMSGGRAWAPRR